MTSEDDDTHASDAKSSEEKRALRPTIFTPPTKPARKKAGESSTRAKSKSVSEPVTPSVLKPTAVPGVERRRVTVSTRDLKTLSPGVAAEVLELALELLAPIVAETVTERKAILWGHETQKSYSNLVTTTLAISQSPLLRKVEGYLTRIIDILEAIDLKAVCTVREGGLGGLFKSVNSKIDTPQELNAAQQELDQLTGYLGVALDELLNLKDKLQQHSSAVNAVGMEVEAAALAALFLSRHLQNSNSAVSEQFTERSMSLTQTLAQIRGGESL
ncbi:MAG: hypothetical protein ABI852_19505, partial [Gemmatimonadaceae bacterium]